MTLKAKIVYSVLIALCIGLIAASVDETVSAQPLIPPAPQPLPATGDCSLDNIYYGAIPPDGERGRVLVFVPGYSGLATDWWTRVTANGVNDMYFRAYHLGYRTAFVNTNIDLKKTPLEDCILTERKPAYDMFHNGSVVSKQIEAIAKYYDVPQVDIIAHSKGGIDVQTAIAWFGSWRYVRNVFTLGTPHQGSLLADFIWSPEGRRLRRFTDGLDRGTLSMRTGLMLLYRLLTDSATIDDHVQYYIGAGNRWDIDGTAYQITGKWLQEHPKGGDNDGAVTVASTLLPYGHALFLEPWNHSQLTMGRNSLQYIHEVLLADVTSPSAVGLTGPLAGTVGRPNEFVAYIPMTVTLPVSYTWSATDQSTILNTTSETLDTATFTWDQPGTKQVTLVVSNSGGSFTVTHEIQITSVLAPTNLTINGELQGEPNTPYRFEAQLPLTVTTPVTYTWRATDQVSLAKTSGTTDTITLEWNQLGTKVIEVEAANELGKTTATHTIHIGSSPTNIEDETEFPTPPESPVNTFPYSIFIPEIVVENGVSTASDTPSATDATAPVRSNYILRGGELEQTVSEIIPIESGATKAIFMLLASEPGVQPELIAPDGTVYALTEVDNDPGGMLSGIATYAYTVNGVLPGDWQVHLTAPAPTGYLLMVWLDTPLQVYLDKLPDVVTTPGAVIELSAISQAEGATTEIKQISVTIADQKTDQMEVESAAVTAVGFTLEYVVPSETGIYEMGINVLGEINGSAFERSFVRPLVILSAEDELSFNFLKALLNQ